MYLSNVLSLSFNMRRLLLILLFIPGLLNAQNYPKNDFRNPLGIPMVLAGNFGECRSNHFHSGLDVKTDSKENYPVYAIGDGYVSRIKLQNGGFGHALYIQHTNGYTSLYAHLNDFAPEIQAYMKKQQYRNRSWTVDLYPKSSMFRVKKGDLIAYSGNTGGSMAPHLHLEIRNGKGSPVNPALFGFDITDNIPPKPYKIAVYDMDNSIYEQNPLLTAVTGSGESYSAGTIQTDAKLAGIGIDVFDYMNGSNNTLNFYTAEVLMDGETQCRIRLDDISYSITRYMNAYVDYRMKKKSGRWIQLLFRLPHNRLTHIYQQLNSRKGVLDISDGAAHDVDIQLIDVFGNQCHISFKLQYSGNAKEYKCDGEKMFKAGQANSFTHSNVKFSLGAGDLYDDICFRFDEKRDDDAYSARYQVHDAAIPVHTYFNLYIKPDKPIPFSLRDKIAMVQYDGEEDDAKGARFSDGWYVARVRNFGEYRLVTDTQAPEIRLLQSKAALKSASRINVKVTENMTSVDRFTGTIDGKWVPFEQSGDLFFYTIDEHCGKGEHKLDITATDENGNSNSFTYTFTR